MVPHESLMCIVFAFPVLKTLACLALALVCGALLFLTIVLFLVERETSDQTSLRVMREEQMMKVLREKATADLDRRDTAA